MYTVRQLAQLAGVTPRTLHHYDAIGLLPPTTKAANGYRGYGPEAVARLQEILLYRELDLDLDEIRRLLDRPGRARSDALRAHRAALVARLDRLRRVVATVDKTILAQEGGIEMNDRELFDGLSAQERAYAEEALERWDPQVVRESHRRWKALTPAEKTQMKEAGAAHLRRWADLMGTDPQDPRVRAVVAEWAQGIEFFWTPTPEALVGLARMYVDDPRFRATYEAVRPGLAEYVRTCVEAVYGP